MREGAYVNSIEALEQFRAALAIFADEVGQSLATIQSEIDDFVEWLEHDQLLFWQREIRVREEHVAQAKVDLHRCLSATIDANRTPSCYAEKKALAAAQHRLQEAESSLAAVRRWIPIVRQAVIEYRMKVEPLRSAVTSDMPVATSYLAASVARLTEYLSIAPPTSGASILPGEGNAPAAAPSLARPAPETAATAGRQPAGSHFEENDNKGAGDETAQAAEPPTDKANADTIGE